MRIIFSVLFSGINSENKIHQFAIYKLQSCEGSQNRDYFHKYVVMLTKLSHLCLMNKISRKNYDFLRISFFTVNSRLCDDLVTEESANHSNVKR